MQYEPEIIEVISFEDERLDAYARLTEAQLRNKLEPEKGIFIAESDKVIERALDASLTPLSLLVASERFDALQDCIMHAAVVAERQGFCLPVFVCPGAQLAPLTGFELTRGILCAMRRPRLLEVPDLLAHVDRMTPRVSRRIAVLEGIVDHTNLGAIFRSAAAMNLDAVLVAPSCCDPLYRRAVRVSMGTVFQVPWTRIPLTFQEWKSSGCEYLRSLGFSTCALALREDALSLSDTRLATHDNLALILGSEGYGLLAQTIESSDFVVRIPMQPGVDSLNVAAASAVTFWELCMRTRADSGIF